MSLLDSLFTPDVMKILRPVLKWYFIIAFIYSLSSAFVKYWYPAIIHYFEKKLK